MSHGSLILNVAVLKYLFVGLEFTTQSTVIIIDLEIKVKVIYIYYNIQEVNHWYMFVPDIITVALLGFRH